MKSSKLFRVASLGCVLVMLVTACQSATQTAAPAATQGAAATQAPAANPLREGLEQERVPDASSLVIFGASGDLTGRKLLPALYSLAHDGLLPAGQVRLDERRVGEQRQHRAEVGEGVEAVREGAPPSPAALPGRIPGLQQRPGGRKQKKWQPNGKE